MLARLFGLLLQSRPARRPGRWPLRDTRRTRNDIVLETRNARAWRGFPPDAVAIGANGTGDQLVLFPDSTLHAVLGRQLFWWDHETGKTTLIEQDVAGLL